MTTRKHLNIHRFVAIIYVELALLLCSLLYPQFALAERFSDETITYIPHPRVSSFNREQDGSWYGTTTDGRTFIQYPIHNDAGMHIERFEIDDYAHFIVEGEVVYSLALLSQKLSPHAQ